MDRQYSDRYTSAFLGRNKVFWIPHKIGKNGMSVSMFEAVAMGIGMLKSSIKMGRGYQSNAMDEYFDPEKLGVEFGKKMIRRL